MELPFSILLVEDHAATRETVRQALADAGFVVHVARDGARALALMSAERPQIVLQDLMLPDIDGFALARKLRSLADGAPLRLIAFSGRVSNLEAQRISELGFDDVITKPTLPSRLVELMRGERETVVQMQSALQSLHELSDPLAPRAPTSPPPSNSQEGEGELLRRCSALSAELTVLRASSQAVLQEGDVEGALITALAACFDAGQDAFGALYVYDGDQLRARVLGSERQSGVGALAGFFGHETWLRAAIQDGRPRPLSEADEDVREAVEAAGVQDAL
ncbi:MAG TPA: response regulator, partial [Polyangiales bacterium]|nr:response regulator [Polyangiales bacterium]